MRNQGRPYNGFSGKGPRGTADPLDAGVFKNSSPKLMENSKFIKPFQLFNYLRKFCHLAKISNNQELYIYGRDSEMRIFQ